MTYVTGWSEQSEGYNPEWQARFDQMYGFNPAKAKALLKEAGYGPGQLKFKILAFTEPGESEGPQVAEALGIYYKDIGVDTEIEVLDWAKVREMFRKKTIQCCIWPNIISWRPSEEWIRISYWSKSQNHHYENEFIDKTYNTLIQAIDPKERYRLTRAIADHLFEEFADIPLFWFANEVVANPKVVRAVDGVSFYLRQGEALGIVGESGCGKTMTALSLLRLVPRPAARIVKGKIMLEGEDLLEKSEREMRAIRGRRVSMILQDPQTSLNPVFTIGNQLIEAIQIHHRDGHRSLVRRAHDALKQVRAAAPERRVQDYPHQISGGMKQRVVGAIAISCEPRVIIADEPTTSLDVTIQAQYLRLLREIQEETNLALIFITHDFGIVAKMCDRVMVMYAGRVVESGPVREIFNHPSHPYTQALLNSVPTMDERVERLYSITGQPPALWDLPLGCRFEARCPHADDRCRQRYPPPFTVGEGHTADCWRLE